MNIDTLIGKVITVEGCDLMGKSTLIQSLSGALRDKGEIVTVVNCPGTTSSGLELRAQLKAGTLPKDVRVPALLENIAEIHGTIVAKAKRLGHTVLIDRGYLSTYAYQVALEHCCREDIFLEHYRTIAIDLTELTLFLPLNDTLFKLRQSRLIQDAKGREIMAQDLMSIHAARLVQNGYIRAMQKVIPPKSTIVVNPRQGAFLDNHNS